MSWGKPPADRDAFGNKLYGDQWSRGIGKQIDGRFRTQPSYGMGTEVARGTPKRGYMFKAEGKLMAAEADQTLSGQFSPGPVYLPAQHGPYGAADINHKTGPRYSLGARKWPVHHEQYATGPGSYDPVSGLGRTTKSDGATQRRNRPAFSFGSESRDSRRFGLGVLDSHKSNNSTRVAVSNGHDKPQLLTTGAAARSAAAARAREAKG